MTTVMQILSDSKIDKTIFKPFYQIFVESDGIFPSYIILVNSSIAMSGKRKHGMMGFGSGYIWSMHEDNSYVPFSVYYIKDVNNDGSKYYIVNRKYLLYSAGHRAGLFSAKNTKALSYNHSFTFTNTSRIKTNNDSFRLMDVDGRYITKSLENKNANLKSDEYREFQKVQYAVDGTLKIDGSCLTATSTDTIDIVPCDNTSDQKWAKSNSTFVSMSKDKCITSTPDKDTAYLTDCVSPHDEYSDRSQVWTVVDTENSLDTKSVLTDKTWKTQKGRAVVLVRADNPWYLNKDITTPLQFVEEKEPEAYSEKHGKYIYKNGNFKSNFVLDTSRPDLGYGHSYSSRQGKACYIDKDGNIVDGETNSDSKVVEGFGVTGSKYDKVLDYILVVLIIFIVLLFVIRRLV
jgi:hypothetical protein